MKKAIRKLGIGSLLALSAVVPASAQQARRPTRSSCSTRHGPRRIGNGISIFSQGSAVLSYDLFLNLEAADSQDLFRYGLNSPRYGLIPEPASPCNPDGLPIGISKTTVATPIKGWPAGDYAGLTCAACHEGQLKYKGKLIRIEGGIRTRSICRVWLRGLDDALASDPDRRSKIRPLGGAARSIDARMRRTSCASELRARASGCTSMPPELRSLRTRGVPDAWMPSP